MEKDALEDALGAVLGRSWVVVDAVLGVKNLKKNHGVSEALREKSLLIKKMHPNLAHLGRPKGPKCEAKRAPRRTKNHPKMPSKF